MKKNTIDTLHVYSKENQVFIKNKQQLSSIKKIEKNNLETWSPINFQWIPIVKLQEKFKQ
ncbi:hypothetical protein EC396_00760 [Lutibacter sp. HS1-25]|uniref:hypothetical protein n=1 Tax=Lutibacter sp. HS1-25 TaxID=2485000 RepID=UPI00101394E8|nr:hypothetical protein [Lutibacter sp. HS1-25]RXP64539.1 hypothetical protein EC396_00760 [Lutibacter sp. HS1-25]